MTLKMQKMELNKQNREEKSRLNYAEKVQENPEFHAKKKIHIREYNWNRYSVNPEFANRLKAKRRGVYKLKKESQLSP